MMNRLAKHLAGIATCTALCLAAAAARAGPGDAMPTTELNAEARTQYKLGTEALGAGRYVEAALHFETATSRTPHAVSWYMAAEAWERSSHPERAADALSRALDVPGLSPELGDKVRARLKSLEASLGTVVFGGQSSFRASLDGSSAIAPPARVHGLPGTHVVSIIPPDRAPFRREVTLLVGKEVAVILGDDDEEMKAAAAAAARVEPKVEVRFVEREVPRPAELRKYVGFGALGLGAASLGAAVILGVSALGARDAYNTSRMQEAYDHVRSVQAWSNVALVTSAVLVAGGLALVLWPADKPSESTAAISAGPTGAVLAGTF